MKLVSVSPCLAAWFAVMPGILASQAIELESTKAVPDPVIAVVNGEEVGSERVEKTLSRRHASISEGQNIDVDLDRLMFKVINDVLLAQEARAMGMAAEEPVISKVESYRQRLAVSRLDWEEISSKAEPSEQEVRNLFADRYRRVTFRVVTAYEKAKAEELYSQLTAGADMAALAKAESVDPYRLRGGLVSDIEHIDLQLGVGELVFSLQPGELSGPVRTDLGWSVVRVETFATPTAERFSEVEGKVRSIVKMGKARRARQELAKELRKKFRIEIDQEALQAIQPAPQPDGRLLPVDPDPEATIVRLAETEEILAKEYSKALLARWKGVRNVEAAQVAAPIVLEGLIADKLLVLEALARGYDRLPEVERAVYAFESDLLVSRYLDEIIAADIVVDQDEIQDYYQEHKEEFHRPPRVRLGQITVPTEEEAQQIADALREGADLAWLAKQESIDRFKDASGDRGWYVPQPGVPDFNADLFEAPVGTVLDPFGIPDNWVILKVMDRQEQGIYSVEEITGNLRQSVFNEKFRRSLDEYLTTLKDRSEIEINQASLEQLQITGSLDDSAEGGEISGHPH